MKKITKVLLIVALFMAAYPSDSIAEKNAGGAHLNSDASDNKAIKTAYSYENKNFRELFYTPYNPQFLSLNSEEIKSLQQSRAHVLVSELFVGNTNWIFPRIYSSEQAAQTSIRIPFMSEYITRSKGLPKHGVVYKWKEKEIAVGYSWPVTKPVSKGWLAAIDEDMKYYERLKPFILKKIEEINRAGAVQLKFVEPNKEGTNFAPIRIVGFNWGDYIRFGGNQIDNIGGGYTHLAQMNTWAFESELQGVVRFTDWEPNQVEGYLLPNGDNTIGRAACYIKADSSDAMLESYIAECLFRSLGFPGLNSRRGILGPREKRDRATAITNEDMVILKMLYDDVIQAGDDKNVVLKKLYKISQEEVSP